jgi:sulfatase maturation enzyme AslB (radical SAM superfamily)
MARPPRFDNLAAMENSQWLRDVNTSMAADVWPTECIRCKESEEANQLSVRQSAITFHENKPKDYLVVDAILDNICNSACQFCNASLSTKYASLSDKKYAIYSSVSNFWSLPTDRIIQIDLSGGEPSASQNCSTLLATLPKNVKSVRINTNGSMIMPEIQRLISDGIDVTLTVSFDGTGKVHDYVRWPITWEKLVKNLMIYREMQGLSINLWSTINALNVGDFDNISAFVKEYGFEHAFSYLKHPSELDIRFSNRLTLAAKESIAAEQIANILATGTNNDVELSAFIDKQDKLRNISITDYL